MPRVNDATRAEAPTLETPRLILRAHTLDDFSECAAMWASPIVTRHIGGRAFTAEESWSRLLRYAGHWRLLGFGYWAIVERGSTRFVGEVGFADFHRDITPSFDGAPEAGWVLAPWSYGQGFATEALGAATAWIDAALDPDRTVCIIDPEMPRRFGWRTNAITSNGRRPPITAPRSLPSSESAAPRDSH